MKKAVIFILIIFLAGSGIYLWQNDATESERAQYEIEIEESQITISELKQEMTELKAENKKLKELSKTNVFAYDTIKVGDKVGEMTVEEFQQARYELEDMSEDNFSVYFTGEVTVTGTYTHYGEEDYAFFYNIICFDDLDKESLQKMPALLDNRDTWFCFENTVPEAEAFFPEGSTGEATIVIDSYGFHYYPSEGYHLANLVEVIEIN